MNRNTFTDFLLCKLEKGAFEKPDVRFLFRFLSAQRFDTDALCADVSDLNESNVNKRFERAMAKSTRSIHNEWVINKGCESCSHRGILAHQEVVLFTYATR